MRGRYLLVLCLAAVAVGEGWHLGAPIGRAPTPEGSPIHTGAGAAATAPTAADEGDLLAMIGRASPRSLPDTHRRRDVRSRPRAFVSPPPRPSRSSAATSPVPIRGPAASPRGISPESPSDQAPGSPPQAAPETPPSATAAATSPAAESGGGTGQGVAQQISPDAWAAGSHGGAPSPPAADPAAVPASIPSGPPRLVPPRVIDTAGTEYPDGAFRVTVRRQDLGSELTVDGAEGTVALRAFISADGSVRSVDVAVSSGSPVLDRAAADAVRRWRFTPATRDGVPIDAYATLRIRYVVR